MKLLSVHLLASKCGGAFIVEPKLRFRRLSKRFVKFVDEYGEDKSSLSCSPFVLDSLDAFNALVLCELLSAASFEYRLFPIDEFSCASWPLKTVDVDVLRRRKYRVKFYAEI